MDIQAKYIKHVNIKGLWNKYDISWELRPDVNILSGLNGAGKSTIMRHSISFLSGKYNKTAVKIPVTVDIQFDDPDATFIEYDYIAAYDRPLIQGEFTAQMAEPQVQSEMDWQIYLLQRRYLDYQVNIGNKMIELLSGNPKDQAKAPLLANPKRRFQDLLDELFSYTNKKIDRKSNEICFYQDDEKISVYKLSAGEKHILVILLTALLRVGEHSVLFMDEPESSLHIEWQEQLINNIRSLNPDIQLILTTHSPALIMQGWVDAVTEVSSISKRI